MYLVLCFLHLRISRLLSRVTEASFLMAMADRVPVPHPELGKMRIKIEAAGKTRLFAILDSLSQR